MSAFKLAWMTDIHLDSAPEPAFARLLRELTELDPHALLVSGDISTSADVFERLRKLSMTLPLRKVYYVLGNHDFYRGDIASVRKRALEVPDDTICWLGGRQKPVALSEQTALIGHDGWGDARIGDALRSPVRLTDFYAIDELRGLAKPALIEALQALGEEAAAIVRAQLEEALLEFKHIVLLTHVPPFREAAWHQGHPSDDFWAPFFACQAVGDTLLELASAHPEAHIKVLCGHTHSQGLYWPLPNLSVFTGAATYGDPQLQMPLLVP